MEHKDQKETDEKVKQAGEDKNQDTTGNAYEEQNEVSSETEEHENLPAEEPKQEAKTAEQVEKELQQHIDELNAKYLRLYSEFENFRKRTAKEKIEMAKYAGEDIISDLLPVLDDFERAVDFNEKSEDIKAIKEGIKLVHQKFKKTLIQKGLKEMNAKEKEFNTDLHEALTKIPAPSKKLKGKVVDVIEQGYFLNDKVIRYAKVVVGE